MLDNSVKTLISSLKRKTYSADSLEGKQQYQIHRKNLSRLSELKLEQVLEECDLEELELTSEKLRSLSLREGVDSIETLDKLFQINFKKLKYFDIGRWQFADWTVFDKRPELTALSTTVEHECPIVVATAFFKHLGLWLHNHNPYVDLTNCPALKSLVIGRGFRSAGDSFPDSILLPKNLEKLVFESNKAEVLQLSSLKCPNDISHLSTLMLKCEVNFGGNLPSFEEVQDLILECKVNFNGNIPRFEKVKNLTISGEYLPLLPQIAPNVEYLDILSLNDNPLSFPSMAMDNVKEVYGRLPNPTKLHTFFPNIEEISTGNLELDELVSVLTNLPKLSQLHLYHFETVQGDLVGLQRRFPGVKITAQKSTYSNYAFDILEFKNGMWNSYSDPTR